MTDMGDQDRQADIGRGQEGPDDQAKQPDATVLHPPMNSARQGIQQIIDCFRFGTPFLKQLILQEADVIYECRVCRSLFRGLLNFVEHKKCFCTERVSLDSQLSNKRQTSESRDYGISPEEAAHILAWGAPVPEKDIHKPTKTILNKDDGNGNKMSNRDASKASEDDKFVMLRSIPTTSRAVEQQVVKPDQIFHEEQLNKMSAFKSLRDQGEDTSKIVGEITIRQAAKAGRNAAPTVVDKRDSLHTLLKTVNTNFYMEKPTSPTASSGGKKETLSVEVDTPKAAVSPTTSRAAVSPRTPQVEKKPSNISPRQKKTATATASTSSQQVSSTRNICKVCKKKCKNWTALAWHMRIHKRPLFKCPMCQYRSPSVYNVRRHIQSIHNLSTDRVDELLSSKLEEKGCEETVENKISQNNNESTPSHTCDICFKTFANRRNVARHKVIHEREKLQAEGKYTPACNATQEEIARGKVLQTMDEKNMRCRRCHKQLSTVRRLQQHCCNHFGYNRYRCRLCPYENNDYTQMRRHMMGKHGRQFRTIQQISEAIKSMKFGVWINLSSQNTEEVDSKKSTVLPKTVKAEDKNPKPGPSAAKAGTSASKQSTGSSKQGSAAKASVTLSEKVIRVTDDGKAGGSLSPPVRVKVETDAKKDVDSPSKDNPSSSSAGSPGTSRRSVVDTVTVGKERETPMRQARLNHRSVSPKGPQEKEEEEDKALLKTMMDKKNMKCLKCKKRFQYHSSLLRHTRIHLLEMSSSSEQGGTKKNRESASKKAQAIKSLINQSQLRCLKCRKRFTSMGTLKQHVGRHLGYNTFKCQYCGYLSHNYSWFKNHLIIKHSNHIGNINDLGKLIGSMKTK